MFLSLLSLSTSVSVCREEHCCGVCQYFLRFGKATADLVLFRFLFLIKKKKSPFFSFSSSIISVLFLLISMEFFLASSSFDSILFDLDDTLYPANTGLASACKKNIEDFLVEKCGFPESQASTLRVELFKTYGSTLAGLRELGYDIDADDYHSFVHGRLPYELIKPDPQLQALLRSISQRKIIFTNSDRNHAIKALDRLGMSDCFDQIICFETMNPNLSKASRPDEIPVVLKPSMDALKIALDVSDVDPRRTLFLDDNVRNIAAGKAVGLRTALVGKAVKTKEADYALETINNLAKVIPEIRVSKADQGSGDQRISRTKSEIDSIVATTAVGA